MTCAQQCKVFTIVWLGTATVSYEIDLAFTAEDINSSGTIAHIIAMDSATQQAFDVIDAQKGEGYQWTCDKIRSCALGSAPSETGKLIPFTLLM